MRTMATKSSLRVHNTEDVTSDGDETFATKSPTSAIKSIPYVLVCGSLMQNQQPYDSLRQNPINVIGVRTNAWTEMRKSEALTLEETNVETVLRNVYHDHIRAQKCNN